MNPDSKKTSRLLSTAINISSVQKSFKFKLTGMHPLCRNTILANYYNTSESDILGSPIYYLESKVPVALGN